MTNQQIVDLLVQLTRIANALELLAEAEQHIDETVSRQAAFDAWRMGQGKHPDD